MNQRALLALTLASLSAGATACGSVETEPEADSVTTALENDTGGYTTDDEEPAFGAEAELDRAALEPTTPITDPMNSDADLVAMRGRPGAMTAHVSIVWGELPPDRTADRAHDWTGSFAVNRGGLVVRRTIGFEDRTDHVLPRSDRSKVDFESVTKPWADGLVLAVIDPEPDSAEPMTLTYTGRDGVSIRLALRDLVAGPVSTPVGDDGKRMVAVLIRDRDACDHGSLRGRWRPLRDNVGMFLGQALAADGTPIGHVRGIYGTRRNGQQVFFGKIIDLEGRFRGILAGRYGDGRFAGRWLTRNGDAGRVQGAYREGRPGDAVGGHFVARWAETTCAGDLPEPPAP